MTRRSHFTADTNVDEKLIVSCEAAKLRVGEKQMLDYLRIRGLALIDDVALELGRGMNVLTGETGAGKSIIVDSLTLLRGGRGRAELVREGSDAAMVEAQYSLEGDANRGIIETLNELGLSSEDASLVVQRSVNSTGRGRIHVQDKLVTRTVLSTIGERLIDICSQHEHHSLTNVGHHIELLDAYAGLEERIRKYQSDFQAYRDCRERCKTLRQRATDRVQRSDYLRFQLEELADLNFDPVEIQETRDKLVFLRDAQKWAIYAQQAQEELYEADHSVWGRLATLAERARRGAGHSSTVASLIEYLEAAKAACEEAASLSTKLADEVSVDQGELQRIEESVAELDRLRRKHGCEIGELGQRVSSMKEELDSLDRSEDELAELTRQEVKLHEVCLTQAMELRAHRQRAAKRLARTVESELAALHIPNARMEVALAELPDAELNMSGLDRVEFMFSANPGEALAPLHKVASGGELSRVLLAMKGVLSTGDRVVTYVFDEVDSGVGGAVAEAIGRRLQRTAQSRQVLCITHLPQIAAFADQHFRVEKMEQRGRTITKVTRLEGEQRVEELARMLGGAKISSSARKHAAALIEEAEQIKLHQGTAKVQQATRSSGRSNKKNREAHSSY